MTEGATELAAARAEEVSRCLVSQLAELRAIVPAPQPNRSSPRKQATDEDPALAC
jgi:hypothetical protein